MPETLDDALDDILDSLKGSRLGLLVGSGISKNDPSCIPGVGLIKNEIMKNLIPQNEEGNYIASWDEIHQNYQFEYFLSTVFRNITSEDYLAKIYKVGNPNKAHLLFSLLALKSMITAILTTNFDTKIEEAEKVITPSESVLEPFFQEDSFDVRKIQLEKIPLIKIHGCADHPDSIRTTLELVSNRDLSEARSKVLQHFFVNMTHTILILGYGFSDYFDIAPIIKNIKSDNKIIHVEHHSGLYEPRFSRHTENLKRKNYAPSISKFKGYRICIDTNHLIDVLTDKKLGMKGDISSFLSESSNDFKWEDEVSKWASSAHIGVRAGVAGMIFDDIRADRKAELLLQKSCDLLRDSGKKYEWELTQSMGHLALVKVNLNHYEEAEKLYNEILDFFKKNADEINVGKTLHNLANLKINIGEYKEAEKMFYESIQLFEKNQDIDDLINSLGQIAMIKHHYGEIEEAEKIYEQTIKMSEEMGSQYKKASSLHGLAKIKIEKKDYDSAKLLLEEAKEIFLRVGDMVYYANSISNLAQIEYEYNNIVECEKLNEEAYNIYISTKQKTGIANSLGIRGVIKKRNGDLAGAKEDYYESLSIHKEIKSKVGITAMLNNLATIYMEEKKLHKAEKYLIESLELSEKINYSAGIIIARTNLKELKEHMRN